MRKCWRALFNLLCFEPPQCFARTCICDDFQFLHATRSLMIEKHLALPHCQGTECTHAHTHTHTHAYKQVQKCWRAYFNMLRFEPPQDRIRRVYYLGNRFSDKTSEDFRAFFSDLFSRVPGPLTVEIMVTDNDHTRPLSLLVEMVGRKNSNVERLVLRGQQLSPGLGRWLVRALSAGVYPRVP